MKPKRNKAYELPISGIGEGHYEQDFVCDTAFFEQMKNGEILSSDVKAHIDVESRRGEYDCTFRLKGTITITCDRCLDPLEQAVDTEYHVVLRYGEKYNEVSEELIELPETERDFDVSGILSDTILLTIPMRHVHPEGECNSAMTAILGEHQNSEETAESQEED
ncbi:MAG: DUF177 domain-containing protein [Muribaculaceae bacterium]|nr:DUF177 domain-containing protein [Muribaculaceae bacterium]